MRFLVLIRIDESTCKAPNERLLTDMGKLIDEMNEAGVMLDTAGLKPTSEGVRLRITGGKKRVTDGPFTEAKEVVGGFFMLQTRSKDEAVHWIDRFLDVHGTEWDIECEVREVATSPEPAQ